MNNLNLPILASNQNNKEITINDQAMAIDSALTEMLTVDFSEADSVLLQEGEVTRNFVFLLASTMQDSSLEIPPIRRFFAVVNNASHQIILSVYNTQAGIVIPAGERALVFSTGTEIIRF